MGVGGLLMKKGQGVKWAWGKSLNFWWGYPPKIEERSGGGSRLEKIVQG